MNELLETKKIETLERIANALEEISSVGIAQRDSVTRIAEALEAIDQDLTSISNSLVDMVTTHPLDDCISKTRTGSFLCVTGHVTTKNY